MQDVMGVTCLEPAKEVGFDLPILRVERGFAAMPVSAAATRISETTQDPTYGINSARDRTLAASKPAPVLDCGSEDGDLHWCRNEVERLQQLLKILENLETQPQPEWTAIAEIVHDVNLMVMASFITNSLRASKVRQKAADSLSAAAGTLSSCAKAKTDAA